MKKIMKAAVISAAAIALLASCASTKVSGGETTEPAATEKSTAVKEKKAKPKKQKKGKFDQEAYDAAYSSGDYAACIAMIQSKKSGKDDIMNALDANMLMYLNESYLESAKAFMDTQSLMQQSAKDTSGGKQFAAAIAGETSVTYTGTIYERLLAYSMRAVNAVSLGDISNAKGIMDTYTGDYKDVIAPVVAQQKELEAQSERSLEGDQVKTALNALKTGANIDIDLNKVLVSRPKKSKETYENSAFLSYLGTVIYAANGDTVHAKDFSSVLKTVNPKVDISEDISVPAGKGRLDVIALSGTIGKRSEATTGLISMGMLPIEGAPVELNFKISYPVFEPQKHVITSVKVTLSDGNSKTAVLVEDFDEAVRIDVASKALGAFNRSIFRNITKNATSTIASITAFKAAEETKAQASSNPLTAKAAQVACDKALAALNLGLLAIIDSEKADLRQGSYFPNKASAAGFTVNPGIYSAKVEYLSGNTVIETKELNNIVVEAGKPTVVVSSCEK